MKFDDFFNNFFNKPKKTPFEEKLGDMMKSLMDFRKMTPDEDEIESVYESLGKPDETHTFEEDGFLFQKHVWHRPEGQYVRIVVSEKDSDIESMPEPKTLEEQLQEALDVENYELAIQLRDKIKEKVSK